MHQDEWEDFYTLVETLKDKNNWKMHTGQKTIEWT
jgi:hypothetical protein